MIHQGEVYDKSCLISDDSVKKAFLSKGLLHGLLQGGSHITGPFQTQPIINAIGRCKGATPSTIELL